MNAVTRSSKTIYSIIVGLPILFGIAFLFIPSINKEEDQANVAGIEIEQNSQVIAPDIFKFKIESTQSGVIIDVRSRREYNSGNIDMAINLDYYSSEFTNEIEKLNKRDTYYIYGDSGNRANSAAEEMKSLGFSNVFLLDGGYPAWLAAGY